MTNRTPGRYLGRLLIAALAVFGGSALIVGADSARAANAAVAISGFAYSPQVRTVAVGDTVTWTNNDAAPHTVTSDSGTTLASGNLTTGMTYQKTFDTAGTYPYHCAIHPSMTGSVVVQAQSTATATTTATSTSTTTATATTTSTTTATATGSATATATATATRTNTPVPPTATAVPPTQGPTQPANAPINVTLSGANEVPPVTTSATGTFRATPGSSSLAFTLTATGTALTQAHIHQGAAGANGPVVAFLFGPNAAGVSSVNNSGTITAANLTGPMAGKTWAEFMTELNAGRLYVNVHSVQNPGGEIRGQIPGTPAAPRTGTTASTSDGLPLLMILFLGAGGLLTLGTASAVALRRRQ